MATNTARTHADLEAEVAALNVRLGEPATLTDSQLAAMIGAREALLWVLGIAGVRPLSFTRPPRELCYTDDVPMPGEAEWVETFGTAF